jgi:hypothetical protein
MTDATAAESFDKINLPEGSTVGKRIVEAIHEEAKPDGTVKLENLVPVLIAAVISLETDLIDLRKSIGKAE